MPSGCGARPDADEPRRSSASRTTTLHDCVEESTPATSDPGGSPSVSARRARARRRAGRGARSRSRGTPTASASKSSNADAVGQQRPRRSRPSPSVGTRELGDLGGGQRLLHLGVGAERRGPLLEQQVGAHVRGRRRPDAVEVLGAQRLVVEVPRAVVGRGAARTAVLEQVDEEERAQQVAVAEHEVLVELRAVLAVEVDVEELALPQRLRDAVHEVEVGHLLVPDLGVHADHVGVLEGRDEGQRVPDRRQQDVAARLVRLGLEREAQAVAAVDRRTAPGVSRPSR